MALPEFVRHLVETKLNEFYERRIPPHVRDQVRMTHRFRGNTVTLAEERPHYRDPSVWTRSPFAQARFGVDKKWTLYCRDQHGRWHLFEPFSPSANFEDVIAEIDRDRTCIFFG